MSWVKLLAAGRSLVGLKDGATRYRVAAGALPKFPAAPNPFRGTTLPSGLVRERSQDAQAEAPVESKPSTQFQQSSQAAPCVMGSDKEPGAIKRLAARIWAATKPAGKSPFKTRGPVRSAVQTELALEKVRVVRNDLSDADIEVVPAGEANKPAQAEAKVADETRAEKIPATTL